MITIDELRELGSNPFHMGYGIVRMYLKNTNNEQAYQFYLNEIAAPGMPPHQHRYSFNSTVVKGALTNIVYRVVGTDPNSTLQIEEREPGHQLNRHLVQPNVAIQEACQFTVYEKEEYSIHWETYHIVKSATPKTVTHITKTGYADKEPRYITDTVEPTEPYHHQLGNDVFKLMPTNQCWEIIEEVMR